MKRLKLIAAIMSTALITSCSYMHSTTKITRRDNHYQQAKSIAPMRIPNGVDSTAFSNKYPVSNKKFSAAQMDVDTLPPGIKG